MSSDRSAAKVGDIVRSVKDWRCRLSFHRWRLSYVTGREFGVSRYHAWEVYETCFRCGEERSHIERNERVAQALADAIGRPWAVSDEALEEALRCD